MDGHTTGKGRCGVREFGFGKGWEGYGGVVEDRDRAWRGGRRHGRGGRGWGAKGQGREGSDLNFSV